MNSFDQLLRDCLAAAYPGGQGERFFEGGRIVASETAVGTGSISCFVQGLLTREELGRLIRETSGKPATYLELSEFTSEALFPFLSSRFAETLRQFEFVPMRLDGGKIHVAFAGPEEYWQPRLDDVTEILSAAYRRPVSIESLEVALAPRLTIAHFLETLELLRTFGHARGYAGLDPSRVAVAIRRTDLVAALRTAIERSSIMLGQTRVARRILHGLRFVSTIGDPDKYASFLYEALETCLNAFVEVLPSNPALFAVRSIFLERFPFLTPHSYADELPRLDEAIVRVLASIDRYYEVSSTAMIRSLEPFDQTLALCVFGSPSTFLRQCLTRQCLLGQCHVVAVPSRAPLGPCGFTIDSRIYLRVLEVDAQLSGAGHRVRTSRLTKLEQDLPSNSRRFGIIGVCHRFSEGDASYLVSEAGADHFVEEFDRISGHVLAPVNGIKSFEGFPSTRTRFERQLGFRKVSYYREAVARTHSLVHQVMPGLRILE